MRWIVSPTISFFAGALAYRGGGWLHALATWALALAVVQVTWPFYVRWARRRGVEVQP
jgi:hypothetical protein